MHISKRKRKEHKMIGDFEIKDEDLAGRIGILETSHGKIETPAFFPVINPIKSEITIEDIKSIGFNNIITNAYIIKKNFNIRTKIHDFLKFNGIIMTDSGAYQVLQYGEIEISNREIVEFESTIEPDIGVILDIPTGDVKDKEEAKHTVLETLRRAKEVEEIIKRTSDRIIWVHPIQGGTFLDLLEYSAKEANNNENYKMLALGSPTVLMQRYEYVPLIEMIYTAKVNVSRGKPFHLFGGGVPHIMPFAVALGVDSFDSASYILYARDNRYMTRERVYRLEDLEYFPCSCPVCSKYTPKELLEMSKEERTKLLAIHNLYVIKEEINEIKQSIKEGRLFEYLQQKAYSHPAVYSAFKKFLQYASYIEKFDPRVKGDVKGIFVYDELSLLRPEILRHEKLVDKIKRKNDSILILCIDKKDELKRIRDHEDVYILHPFYGPVPYNIFFSYPYFQTEYPLLINDSVRVILKEKIKKFLREKGYKTITVIGCENLHINSVRNVPVELFLNQF